MSALANIVIVVIVFVAVVVTVVVVAVIVVVVVHVVVHVVGIDDVLLMMATLTIYKTPSMSRSAKCHTTEISGDTT